MRFDKQKKTPEVMLLYIHGNVAQNNISVEVDSG